MKSKYNPARGGHAPGHLRKALLDWLDDWPDSESPGPARVGEQDRPIKWLLGKLWNCTDILPSISRNTLAWGGIENVWTYAQAVRALRREFGGKL